jgi:DNA-binding CsgD family transcriptional regulator
VADRCPCCGRSVDPIPEHGALAGLLGGLTPRQREVAALVAAGLTNDEIAGQLGMSRQTVKNHVTGIFRRSGVHSRAAIAREVGEATGLAAGLRRDALRAHEI